MAAVSLKLLFDNPEINFQILAYASPIVFSHWSVICFQLHRELRGA